MRLMQTHDAAPDAALQETGQAVRIWRMVLPITEDGTFDPSQVLSWTNGRSVERAFELCQNHDYEVAILFDRHYKGVDDKNTGRKYHKRAPVMDVDTIERFVGDFFLWARAYYAELRFYCVIDTNEFDYLPTLPNNDNARRLEAFARYLEGFKRMAAVARSASGLPGLPIVVGGMSGHDREQDMVQVAPYVAGKLINGELSNVWFAFHANSKSDSWVESCVKNLHKRSSHLPGARVMVDEDTNLPASAMLGQSSLFHVRARRLERVGVVAYGVFTHWPFDQWGPIDTRGVGVYGADGQRNQSNAADLNAGSQAIGEWEATPVDIYDRDLAKAHVSVMRRFHKLAIDREEIDSEIVNDPAFIRRYRKYLTALGKAGQAATVDVTLPPIQLTGDNDVAVADMERIRKAAARCDSAGKWHADIWGNDGETIHEGPFDTFIEAVAFMRTVRFP